MPIHCPHCGMEPDYSLSERGYAHFVPFTELPATIFMDRGVRVPAWFGRHYAGRFLMRKTSFIKGNHGIENDAGCPVSSPERAILEFLLDVPARQLLNEAYQLLEMMMTLRPRLIEKLLSDCSSIKVKRLFFLLADDLNPPWWERVGKEEIDLGAGCRVIDKDGSFNSKYNLVVKPWREI